MRVGISGTHGTGKTTLAEALCARLPGHAVADEPYYLLEEQGYEFGFPPSLEDYRALLACSVRSLSTPPLLPGVVFDRTPLDYLAYMAATGADPSAEANAAALRPAFASLDLLVITLITPETEQVLPPAEMPGLRAEMNDTLLELVYDDPLNAWGDIPVLELSGPLDARLDVILAATGQSRRPRKPGPDARNITDRALPSYRTPRAPGDPPRHRDVHRTVAVGFLYHFRRGGGRGRELQRQQSQRPPPAGTATVFAGQTAVCAGTLCPLVGSLTVSAGSCALSDSEMTLTVQVKPAVGGTPAGTVTIKAGSVTICAITLSSGKGTCTLTPSKLRPGTYQLVASYAARTPYAASTFAKKTLRVTN